LREQQRAATGAVLQVALNPGHEIGDVITITDSALACSNKPVRITALHTEINPEAGTWDQQVTCSGV